MDSFNEILIQIRVNNERKRKRRIISGLSMFLVLLIAVSATIALLNTRTGTESNELAFGQTKISVIENEDYDWAKKEVKLVIQEPWEGYVPGVARVMLVPYLLDDEGNYISCDLSAMEPPEGNKMKLGDIELELENGWENDWFYQDGYFYYKTVLYPEAGKNETTILLKKVSFAGEADDMKEKYDGAEVKVDVIAAILQAEGSAPDTGSVLETEWNVIVNGDTVSPRP